MLTKDHILDLPCIKLTISKLIGLAIVVFSLILKVPQILKITSKKSSEGLSFIAFYIELITYTFSFGYNLHYKNPFSTYGENVFLMAQGIIILFLIKKYDNSLSSSKFWLYQLIYVLFSASLIIDLLPEEVHKLSILINIAFNFAARAPQILLNFQNKSTGQLSFITVFLSFAGGVARTFTILVEVKDALLLTLMISATILNGILVLQFILYRKAEVKTTKGE